jgi:hypothetical protein
MAISPESTQPILPDLSPPYSTIRETSQQQKDTKYGHIQPPLTLGILLSFL